MTKQELSQLYWLNREIEEDKRRLAELEAASMGCTSKIAGLPHVGGNGDKVGDLAVLIAEQRDLIQAKVKQSLIEYNRLNRYIESIPDAQIRQILSLRYVNGFSWQQVAASIGGGNTKDSVRKIHDRFLKLSVLSAPPVL